MRLFVALELPAGVRAELSGWARHALPGRDGVRRLEGDALHVTLCFLGWRDPTDVGVVASLLEACARPIGPVSVGAPIWLPPRKPRALAVELHDPEAGVADLQADLAAGLVAELAWEPERRRFRPHVTVIRMPPGAGAGVRGVTLPPTPDLEFTPRWVALYRSRLERAGARYEALARVRLE